MEKRNIKTIKTFTQSDYISIDYRKIAEVEKHLTSFKEYDLKGNLIREITYSPVGEIENNYSSEYDENNYQIVNNIFDENNKLLERHEYQREKDGRILVEKCFYSESSDFDTTYYKYDDNNNLIEKTNFDSDNELYAIKKNVYKNNNLVNSKIFNEYDELELEENFLYNEKNEMIENVEINHLEKEKRYLKYEYNDSGYKTKTLIFNRNKQLIAKSYFEYDVKNQLIEQYDEDEYHSITTKFIYNENGDVIIQERYNKDEELIIKFENEYQEDLLIKTTSFAKNDQSKNENLEEEEFEETNSLDEENLTQKAIIEYEYEFF